MQQPAQPRPTGVLRYPLLAAALAFSAGVLGGTHTWRPPLWWLITIVILLGAAAWWVRERPRAARILALAALGALGALSLEGREERGRLAGLGRFTDGRETVVTARLTRDSMARESAWGGARQRVELETECIESEGVAYDARLGLRLTVYAPVRDDEDAEEGSIAFPPLQYGQRVRFPTRLRLPRNFGNPGNFDYRGDRKSVV